MPIFKKFFEFLNSGEVTPRVFGTFHIVWLALVAMAIITLVVLWKKEIIKYDKKVLIAAAVVVAVFELYKQINVIFGDGTKIGYDFDHFPYRFNTLLIYLGIIGGLTKNKVHNSITAFIGTYLLAIGTYRLLIPQFSEVVGRNVQTMVSYGAMVVVGVFLWVLGKIKPELKTFLKALPTFLMVYAISVTLNVLLHGLNINIDIGNLLGSCPICDLKLAIWNLISLSILAFLIVLLAHAIKKLVTTDFDAEYGKNDEIAKSIRTRGGHEDDEEGIFKFSVAQPSKNESYMDVYFSNLSTNFGYNSKGSCSYVAMAMLLSYYDTILCDTIIPEDYDISTTLVNDDPALSVSPGIRRITTVSKNGIDYNPGEMTYEQYVEFINIAQTSCLHEKLLSIALEKGGDWIDEQSSKDVYGKGVFSGTYDRTRRMLEYYLQKVAVGFNKSDYKVYGLNYENDVIEAINNYDLIKEYTQQTRKYAINLIKQGIPVILNMAEYNHKTRKLDAAHTVVAYAYSEEKDELYCHMGWSYETATKVRPEYVGEDVPQMKDTVKTYDVIYSAIVLEFFDEKIRHIHSNNYRVKINGGNFFYCPEGENGAYGTYTTSDQLIVEFDKSKTNCKILGVSGEYRTRILVVPQKIGNVNVFGIYGGAFRNLTKVKKIYIHADISTIESNTFKNCTSVEEIYLPQSIRTIKPNAFRNCKKIRRIYYGGTEQQWMYIDKQIGWNNETSMFFVECLDGERNKYD